MPGTAVLADNVVHLLSEGQLAAAQPELNHTPCDADRDCTGPAHCCPCHTGSSFVVADQHPTLAPAATLSERSQMPAEAPRPGHRTRIFRPPVAV